MSKTIKVIDLLNMISKGEELPKKIKIGDKEYHYCKSCKVYEDEKERDIRININEYCLNDKVEIIEEQPEIDIQGLEELNENADEIFNDKYGLLSLKNSLLQNRETINQLIKAVKQLDNQINNK